MATAPSRAAGSPLAAMRAEPAVVVALIAAVGLAWWSTAERMGGMDAGPGTTLGSVGWFAGVWATMMAAMMLPSLAPAAAAFTTSVRRGRSQVLLFAAGYLTVWSAAGIGAYGLFELGGDVFAGSLAWHSGGRWLAAGVLGLAALYQVTPIKRTFLSLCRSHQHSVGEPWRDARRGALTMGMRNGGWCLGCSWALMAALFALGVMSLVWMGLIAVLVALEKIGPSERGARLATAGVMAVVTAAILLAPHDLPGFVVPDTHHDDQMMQMMG